MTSWSCFVTGRVFTGDWTGFKSAVRFISMLLKEMCLLNCLIRNIGGFRSGVLGITHRKKSRVSHCDIFFISFLRVKLGCEGRVLRTRFWPAKPGLHLCPFWPFAVFGFMSFRILFVYTQKREWERERFRTKNLHVLRRDLQWHSKPVSG